MGDIAEGLINGDFDFYSGEYIGRGYGFPRTYRGDLHKKQKKKYAKTDWTASPEIAYIGVSRYIHRKYNGKGNMPSTRSIVNEYFGTSGKPLKEQCLEIAKNFGNFVKWFNNKLK